MPEDAESFPGVESPSQSGGSVLAVPPPLQPAKDSPYYGCKGWLAFFCVVHVFVAPLFALVTLALAVPSVSKAAGRYPGLVFITFLESIGDLAVVGFGVYTGIMLYKLRPGAARLAKRYLLTALGWSFLAFALPYMGGALPSRVIEAMLVEALKGAFRAMLGFAIWYTYFSVSKRVKATFPEG